MCTSLTLSSLDQHQFLARTMDVPVAEDWHVILMNQPTWQPALTTSRPVQFPFVGGGRQVADQFIMADGVNTAGLACAELQFPIRAKYQPAPSVSKLNLTPQDFIFWVLFEHTSVEAVAADLANIELVARPWLADNKIFSFHWIVSDQTGDCLIIESTKEGRLVVNSELGVLTNSPDYPTHVANLTKELHTNNGLAALKAAASQRVLANEIPTATNTPTTRFLYAAIAKLGTSQPINHHQAINWLFNLLDQVAIPFTDDMLKHANYNFTHYQSICDTTSLTYRFRSTMPNEKQTVFRFELTDLLTRYPHQNSLLK